MAVGLAMDAFAVAVACGLAFDRRDHAGATRIAFSFGAFQAGMPVVGWLAGRALREYIGAFDHWIAFGLLGYLGVHMILAAIRAYRSGESLTRPGQLRLLALSIATSIDALTVGVALAVLGVRIAQPALVIGVITFAISYLGIVLGHEFERVFRGRMRRNVQVAGGLMLVLIGAQILVEHLLATP